MGAKANVTKDVVVPVPANELYNLLTDYDRYKEIWPGDYKDVIVSAKRKNDFGRKDLATVRFDHVPVMGYSMSYTLNIEGVPGRSVLWTLNTSSLIKSNVGGWRLQDKGNGETLITYGCVVELNANVPGFVTNFILGQAFPKMLRTFSKSATREWEEIQEERRKRFERPLQAAAGSLNTTIRSLETAAESAAAAAKALAGSTVSDFSSQVDESLLVVRNAMTNTRSTIKDLESPKLESTLDENMKMLDAAATSLKSLANATVLELSTQIDEALRALESAANSATTSANELAGRTASQLADMQAGKMEPETPGKGSEGGSPNWGKRMLSSTWTAVANGALSVLEAVVPGDRPPTKPASKRERLGNILGKDWRPDGAKELPALASTGADTSAPSNHSSAANAMIGTHGADEDSAQSPSGTTGTTYSSHQN